MNNIELNPEHLSRRDAGEPFRMYRIEDPVGVYARRTLYGLALCGLLAYGTCNAGRLYDAPHTIKKNLARAALVITDVLAAGFFLSSTANLKVAFENQNRRRAAQVLEDTLEETKK